jgi:hypothetical protein
MAGPSTRTEKWIIYCCAPIDFGWEFTTPVSAKDERLFQILAAARKMPGGYAWEGDFRYEPRYLVWVSDDASLSHGYIWKQENNGTTYIAMTGPVDEKHGPHVLGKVTVEIDACTD